MFALRIAITACLRNVIDSFIYLISSLVDGITKHLCLELRRVDRHRVSRDSGGNKTLLMHIINLS